MTERHIVMHEGIIKKKDRRDLAGHGSFIVWLTGLSGSGKSSIAHELEAQLHDSGARTYVLDGDNVRHGMNNNLGFSAEDREENIRRVGEVAKLFVDAGIITITAFISPYTKDRNRVREIVEDGEFIEVYVKCPIEVCEERDTKGLYEKARAGIIKQFTGIDDPYEEPPSPEITLETDQLSLEESVARILDYLEANRYLKS